MSLSTKKILFMFGVFFGYAHSVFGVGDNANSLLATVSIVSNLYQSESDDTSVLPAVLRFCEPIFKII